MEYQMFQKQIKMLFRVSFNNYQKEKTFMFLHTSNHLSYFSSTPLREAAKKIFFNGRAIMTGGGVKGRPLRKKELFLLFFLTAKVPTAI